MPEPSGYQNRSFFDTRGTKQKSEAEEGAKK
jgi:hypothetical protein